MSTVKVEFAVTWKGTQEAELSYLLDGGVVVPLAGQLTIGAGKIVVSYLAGNTGLHPLEWGWRSRGGRCAASSRPRAPPTVRRSRSPRRATIRTTSGYTRQGFEVGAGAALASARADRGAPLLGTVRPAFRIANVAGCRRT